MTETDAQRFRRYAKNYAEESKEELDKAVDRAGSANPAVKKAVGRCFDIESRLRATAACLSDLGACGLVVADEDVLMDVRIALSNVDAYSEHAEILEYKAQEFEREGR